MDNSYQEIEVFRLDKKCFIIFLPSKGINSFLRIGNAPALTPLLNRRIRLILLSEVITQNYQLELESSKNFLHDHPEFIALPHTLQHFQKRLEKLVNKNFDLYSIPIKTGKVTDEQPGKLRVLFYKDKNVTIVTGEKELFNLKQEIGKPYSALPVEKQDRLYLLAEIASLATVKSLDWDLGHLSIAEETEQERIIGQEWSEVNGLNSAIQQDDDLQLYVNQESEHFKEHFALEFHAKPWLTKTVTVEIGKILKVGDTLEVVIGSQSEKKSTVTGIIIEGRVIQSDQLYQYHVIFQDMDQELIKQIELIKSFRLYKLLKRLFNKGEG